MKIHDLTPPRNSRRKAIRAGRGIGGKRGKTAGRGMKGQRARGTIPVGFEGGQMPLSRRLPKLRGFNNPFRVEYKAVNLTALAELKESEINPEVLAQHGLLKLPKAKPTLVKILGEGEIKRAIKVSAHAFSKSAQGAIEAAGGSVEILPKPWGDRRPPAKGSAHTNR